VSSWIETTAMTADMTSSWMSNLSNLLQKTEDCIEVGRIWKKDPKKSRVRDQGLGLGGNLHRNYQRIVGAGQK